MYCMQCDRVGLDGDFCHGCGGRTVFSKYPCPKCTAPNWVTSKFCESCGIPIQVDMKEAAQRVMEMRKEN